MVGRVGAGVRLGGEALGLGLGPLRSLLGS